MHAWRARSPRPNVARCSRWARIHSHSALAVLRPGMARQSASRSWASKHCDLTLSLQTCFNTVTDWPGGPPEKVGAIRPTYVPLAQGRCHRAVACLSRQAPERAAGGRCSALHTEEPRKWLGPRRLHPRSPPRRPVPGRQSPRRKSARPAPRVRPSGPPAARPSPRPSAAAAKGWLAASAHGGTQACRARPRWPASAGLPRRQPRLRNRPRRCWYCRRPWGTLRGQGKIGPRRARGGDSPWPPL
jgi:hypothetical protein